MQGNSVERGCRDKLSLPGRTIIRTHRIQVKQMKGPLAGTAAAILMIAYAYVVGHPAAASAQTRSATTIPRTSDGKPDLSGVWEVLNTAAWNIQDHNADTGTPPGQSVVEGNEIPYQGWALEKKKENFAHRMTEDTDSKCYMPGVPRITYMPYPFRIVETPQYVTILYEYIHIVRTIYTNGSTHPEGMDWWMGDSRGRWDGDTLVVDVTDFNDRTWFDKVGNFHSDALHVVERYSFIDKDHLDYEVSVEDPKVFTRPWKMRMPIYRRIERNVRPLEYDCNAFEHLFQLPEGAGQLKEGNK
jgi:hypothetical protein